MNTHCLYRIFLASLLYFSSAPTIGDELKNKFSGYARVVAGILDEADATYFGYDDNISFDQNSLIGVQGQTLFNDKLSVTGLGLLHSNSNTDSGIEWLYLSYRPTKAINIKVGQMQTPFYSLSDTLDVGYTYPWVIAPKEVYSDFVFKKFRGIDLRYSHITDDYSAHIETYYGSFNDDVFINDSKLDVEAENLMGLIGELRIDNLHLRASYHIGDVSLELPSVPEFAQSLSLSGFTNSATTLDTDDKKADFVQLSTNYESLNYFLKAEWMKIKIDSDMFADVRGYYLTYGHYFGNFTALITYGDCKAKLPSTIDEIPIGLSPQLDQLAFGYQSIMNDRADSDTESWALGLRWDFQPNMALKTELKHINSHSDDTATFNNENPAQFDNEANLLSFALEWVF